jgi:hypothetical protein
VKDELGNIVRDIEVAIRIESSVEEVVAFSKDGYYHCILHIREDDLYRPLPVMVDYDNIRLLETVTIISDQKYVVLDVRIRRYLLEETVTETFNPTTTITFTVPTITLYWVGTRTYTTIIGTKTKIVEEFVSITDNKGTTITEKIIDVEEYEREHMFEHIFSILPWIVGLFIFAIISVYLAKKTGKKLLKNQQGKQLLKRKK